MLAFEFLKAKSLKVPLDSTSPTSTEPSTRDAAASAEGARGKPLNLAVLLDYINFYGGGYEAELRDALEARCRRDGHNLYLLYGAALDGPAPGDVADNALFKILRPGVFDGIIAVSALLASYCERDRVSALLAGYRPTRLCSLGLELPGVPSIVLDNRTGMEEAVNHLLRDHGCRRLAFLAGPPKNVEAEARFRSYRKALDDNHLAYDPALVACGYFRPGLGRMAMGEILARGVEIDGVVAGSDAMAVGAIEVLRQSGCRVPQDVPVIGFDDLVLARLGNPPLTTVAQPFETFADLAVRLIEDQVAGRPVAPCTEVPPRFVRRQSCGCGFHSQPYRIDTVTPGPGSDPSRKPLAVMEPKLAAILRTRTSDGTSAAHCLIDGIRAEAKGESDAFQRAVGALLEGAGDDNEQHRALHSAITCLRDGLWDRCDLHLERAFYEGLSLVALSNTTTQMQHRLALDDNYGRLLTVGENASAAFDLSSLKEALVRSLPTAGVRTTFLSCSVDGERDMLADELEGAICLRDGVEVEPAVRRFPASQLIPPGLLGPDRRHTLLVFPMAIEAQLLGVVAFDYADGTNAYTAFRNEITAVLKSIRLHQELVAETQRRERSVQERLAATKRMEALSVLAGGVAHDLNNALGPLVALPDVILDELGRLPAAETTMRDLRADIESIKTASLRAAQTIKDLLTLGRQGKMVKEGLDLNRVVKSCLADSSLRFAKEGNLRVNMTLDFAPEPLAMRGSEAQLARAVANLVRNAVEAVSGDGEVTVRTARAVLTSPLPGYETIPPGQYVVLAVSDNGPGIGGQDLGRVFEPFFTTKRAGESTGSGLGLAIVHGVVKEHEGFIDLTSVPGRGTTFALYFPLARLAAEATKPVALGAPSPARILVVDDEAIQLSTCKRVLVELGYQVDTMKSGVVAYHAFQRAAPTGESPYDLVIMDVLLGERLDGFAILERIRRLFPEQKAIVASGHDAHEDSEPTTFVRLPKPYTVDDLARAVAQALAG